MNPARFQTFALAYTTAIKDAAVRSGVFLTPGENINDYALRVTMGMLDRIETLGVESVQHYYLNTYGGAFRAVGVELGIPGTAKGIQNYLDG